MGNININAGRTLVAVKPGRTVLAALSESRVFIPSACGGQGKCGLCAIKVKSGATPSLTAAETALLSPDRIKEGYRLSCQIKTDADLSIEIPEEYFSIRRFNGKLVEKKALTADILGLTIKLLPGQKIEFKAGQYVQLRSPAYGDAPPVMRGYSMASVPSEKEQIELIVRRVRGGICTTWIFDHLKEGDLVQFSGPYGNFCLNCSASPMIMIASGSGIAPILSILKEVREKKMRRNIRFFFGARASADLFKLDELEALRKELPDFSFVPVLSNEPRESGWRGERGLVTEAVNGSTKNLEGHEAYLCGAPAMVAACVKLLKSKGVSENRIYYDKF